MTLPTSKPPEPSCEYVGNAPTPWCGTHDRPAVTCFDLKEKDALLAAREARIGELEADVENLVAAVRYAAILYAKPTGYRTSKEKWSPNMSIGFETRFEMLVEKAVAIRPEVATESEEQAEARKALGTKGV